MLAIPNQNMSIRTYSLMDYSVKQRQKLVDILLTKDDSALLRVVKILETCECGYKDLARKFFAHMDALQIDKDRKASST